MTEGHGATNLIDVIYNIGHITGLQKPDSVYKAEITIKRGPYERRNPPKVRSYNCSLRLWS
jgi:hypothetical protein